MDPDVEQIIVAEAARLGVRRRELPKEEIIDRCILALVNEGARILAERIADTPADIDAIWCNGYGFPRWRGGPMFHADCLGTMRVRQRIGTFERQPGLEYWSPAPLLDELARHSQTFGDWAAKQSEAR
jgi:3-hydroxyacyl-CoA dehydrogenase